MTGSKKIIEIITNLFPAKAIITSGVPSTNNSDTQFFALSNED